VLCSIGPNTLHCTTNSSPPKKKTTTILSFQRKGNLVFLSMVNEPY
jgi:hypothetical protein